MEIDDKINEDQALEGQHCNWLKKLNVLIEQHNNYTFEVGTMV